MAQTAKKEFLLWTNCAARSATSTASGCPYGLSLWILHLFFLSLTECKNGADRKKRVFAMDKLRRSLPRMC